MSIHETDQKSFMQTARAWLVRLLPALSSDATPVTTPLQTPPGKTGSWPKLADFRFGDRAERISPTVLAGLVRLWEFLVITGSGMAIFMAYIGGNDAGQIMLYLVAALAVAGSAIMTFEALHLYTTSAFITVLHQLSRLIAGWTLILLGVLAVVFFAKLGDHFSRVWMAVWYLSGLVTLLLGRMILSLQTRAWARAGRLQRRAVLVGGGAPGAEVIKRLEGSDNTDIRIAGIFDDRSDDRVGKVIKGYPKLGTVKELVEFARKTRVDLLIVTLPLTAQGRINQILKQLWVLPVDIRLSAHSDGLLFRPRSFSTIGNVPVINVIDKPIADWDHFLKRAFDKLVGSLALIAALPVMALTALAIRLESKGPVLFKQKRFGFNNELVEVYKFRSMYTDKTDANASKLVTKHDPRVTKVGRIIRKTSLDELPQLFNVVFKGNLSLVGPRPHAVQAKAANKLYNDAVDGYFARHRVKPGITGWAQINGWRGETDTEEKIKQRVEHDLYYIENWSVLFDLYILLMTPVSLLKNRDNAF